VAIVVKQRSPPEGGDFYKGVGLSLFIFIGTLDAFGFSGIGLRVFNKTYELKTGFQRIKLQLVLVFKKYLDLCSFGFSCSLLTQSYHEKRGR
jgi:hypothetical protein